MKKASIVLLTILFAMSMNFAVLASEEKISFDAAGMKIAFPEELKDTKGIIIPYALGAVDDDHHTYGMTFVYVGLPTEEANALANASELSDEEREKYEKAQSLPILLMATEDSYDEARKACEEFILKPFDYDNAEELGSADGYTFYAVLSTDEEYLSTIGEEYAEEFEKLKSVLLEMVQKADLYKPVDAEMGLAGQKLEFTTTDLDGNPVTSEELFSGNKITMLNLWGTWCPNCLGEMEELAEIHSRMQEKGCGIVGIEFEDAFDEDTIQAAKELMEESGTNYPNVIIPEGPLKDVMTYPTSIFVDQEGVVLDTPILGAAVDQYESKLEALLNGDESAAASDAEDSTEIVALYKITVVDENGPVEDVAVQFCNDTSCRFESTDENGEAAFEAPVGPYEVHIAEVPDGYAELEDIFNIEDGSYEVTIQLQKES